MWVNRRGLEECWVNRRGCVLRGCVLLRVRWKRHVQNVLEAVEQILGVLTNVHNDLIPCGYRRMFNYTRSLGRRTGVYEYSSM